MMSSLFFLSDRREGLSVDTLKSKNLYIHIVLISTKNRQLCTFLHPFLKSNPH